MADQTIKIIFENGDAANEWLTRQFQNADRRVKYFVNKLADHTLAWIRIYAPTGETMYLQQHIDRGRLHYVPGGAGGGGSWVVELGVKRGHSLHPIYVHNGTGIYAGNDVIRARNDRAGATVYARYGDPQPRLQGLASNLRAESEGGQILREPTLTFRKRGEDRRFRTFVKGQRKQPYVYLAYKQAQIYTAANIGSALR